MSQLDILKQYSTVVADTGNIELIKKYSPNDATTNPSIILQSIKIGAYKHLLNEAIQYGNKKGGNKLIKLTNISNKILVNIGTEILKYIPGRVSTEVDARLSFDTKKCIEAAEHLIEIYELEGISRERVLIKLAATWEGIQAAKILEKKDIKCNLTLLFSFAQAQACADANVFLISPFVGRIYDWYNNNNLLKNPYSIKQDPGVLSVIKIFNFYKKYNYKTTIMAASFRNIQQILELSGCDALTIAPTFLEELSNNTNFFKRKLQISNQTFTKPQITNESKFRFEHNQDAMAAEKLSEGIRMFVNDQQILEQLITKTIEFV